MRTGYGHSNKMEQKVAPSRVAVCLLVACALGSGCAINGNGGIPNDLMTTDKIVTNSVAKSNEFEGIDATDAEVIKTTIAQAPKLGGKQTVGWTNSETGSSGTIVAIDRFKGKHGQECRGFKTSVDTFTGVSLYNGEACQVSGDQWVLSWFKPA